MTKPLTENRAHTRQREFNPNETYHEIVFSERWRKLRSEDYQRYREDWDRVPREKRSLDFPIHLDIETTTVCNLKCPMCPRTIQIAQNTFGEIGSITREQYADIIDQGVAHGLRSVKLNYLGEPLVHKDVVWQVQYAKDKGIIDVMMNSNATALTKKMGEMLLRAGLDNMFISFDAVNPRDYERQRVGTTIGRIIDNIYTFVRLRDRINPACQVRLSMVMYQDPKWREQFEAMRAMWNDLVDAIGYGYFVERDPNLKDDLPEVPGFYCPQPFQRMFLKYNGNVTVCCADDKDELIVGNWHKQKLYDIWNGPAYRKVRQMHAEGHYYDIDLCRNCHVPHSK